MFWTGKLQIHEGGAARDVTLQKIGARLSDSNFKKYRTLYNTNTVDVLGVTITAIKCKLM
jgi:hypothetical protein